MAISGLVKSYQAIGDKSYLKMAVNASEFIEKNLRNGKGLYRNYKKGKSSINAFLDDYSAYVEALINLYEVTLEQKYIVLADSYTQYCLEKFLDPKTNMFFYTSNDDSPLVSRKKELSDNVVPGSNSMMARNLMALGTLLYKEEYMILSKTMALQMVDKVKQSRQPDYYGNWCALFSGFAYSPYEVVVVGNKSLEQISKLQMDFHPNAYYSGGMRNQILPQHESKWVDGETMIYVCQNRTCKLPTTDVNIARKLLVRE